MTLDGKPVPYFGVSVTSEDLDTSSAPLPVHSPEGRFSLKVQPGRWNIIIAGPGFARHVVPAIDVSQGHANVPLEIAVDRGHSISGVVTDEVGNTIGGAIVSIEQAATNSGDLLWERSRGNLSTITRGDGFFEIRGFTSIVPTPKIKASLSRQRSFDHELLNADSTLTLVLHPVGAIDGLVIGATPSTADDEMIIIRSKVSNSTIRGAAIRADGTFRIDDVPVGEYQIGRFATHGNSGPVFTRTSVLVVAGQSASVSLPIP